MAAALVVFMSACVMEPRTASNLSISMIALNQGQPFVSKDFAERLALLVIEQKYPEDLFVVRGSAHLADKGDVWSVSFDNGLIGPDDKSPLPMVGGKLVPRRLTITIRKTNGEIVAIT